MSLVSVTGAAPAAWDGAVAPEVTAEGYTSTDGLVVFFDMGRLKRRRFRVW